MPWIEEKDAGSGKVGSVASHEMQAVTQRSGGNQTIARRNDFTQLLGSCGEFTPDMAGFQVERKNAVGIELFKREKPFTKRLSPLTITE